MLAHLPLVKRNIGRVISSCQFVCIGDTHILNSKHTLVRTEILSIISFYENVKDDVFTQFCWGVHIRLRIWTGGSKSARTPTTVVELSLVPILIDAFMNDNE